jgi:hypothetical protein
MIKRFTLLFSLVVLPPLALWLRAADPVNDPARAAFERGNTLLRDARQACSFHAPDLLRQAAGQYRDCLVSPASNLDGGPLFSAARHNLELTKLLLAQESPLEKANGGEGQKSSANGAKEETGAGQGSADDPFSPANRKDAKATSGEANAKEGASPKSEAAKEGISAKVDTPKESTGWNDRPRRDPAAGAEKPPTHEPHPFDSQCPV